MGLLRDRVVASLVVVAGVAACGGSSSGGGVGPSDATASGDGMGGSSGGEGGASGGDDSGTDGSWIISGGSSSGASSSSSGASSSGSASSSGGGLGDGGPNQTACGTGGPCDSMTQVCCATRAGRSCTTAAMCAGDVLRCSGTNSCPAGSHEICCEELAANGTITTRCAAACPTGSRQLCTTKADCKAGDECRRGADGYGFCVNLGARDGGASDAAGD